MIEFLTIAVFSLNLGIAVRNNNNHAIFGWLSAVLIVLFK